MSVVIDASAAAGWFIGDEVSPYSDAVLDVVASSGALAPSLWPYEVANMLRVAERRHRMSPEDVREALEHAAALPVDVRSTHALESMPDLARLARDHGLSVYDASYLRLAAQTGSTLATLDRALQGAAQRAGLPLFAP